MTAKQRKDVKREAAKMVVANAIEAGPIMLSRGPKSPQDEWDVSHCGKFILGMNWAVNFLNGKSNQSVILADDPHDARFAVVLAAIEAGGLELAKRIKFGPI
jgi:hypothetical protein